jgi:hypothetical protein
MGDKPKLSIDGKSAAQLCKESTSACKKAAFQATSTTAKTAIGVSMPSLFVNQSTMRDARFARNKLSAVKLTPPSQGSFASFPPREPMTELSPVCKENQSSLSLDIFENLSTPNSKATAKKTWDKIVENSPSAKALIEDSLELGWDMLKMKTFLLRNYRVEN